MKQQEIKLEDLIQYFPEMPSELRIMVEEEVQKQLKMASQKGGEGIWAEKRS